LLSDPGRAQGIRKSTALRTLAGEYFTDELADLGSKDAAMQTRGAWIIELSELDSLGHSEVARIKAFMSRTTDRFRPPYGMRLVESPRQCVFAAPSITARICATRRVGAVSGLSPAVALMWRPWPAIGTSCGRKRRRGSMAEVSGG